MTTDEIMFWNDYPKMLPLYEEIASVLEKRYLNMSIKVSKTQISFYNRHMFAMVSTSKKRKKDWPKEFVMLSVGLPYPLDHPRVLASVEAYPGRWTHHIALAHEAEMDDELLEWIDAAYQFSESKR